MSRSGVYVTQPGGFQAFVPSALPPEPSVMIDAEMYALLSAADRALGRLDGSIQTLPNPDLFVFMYVRKEAVLSSQIEGTQSSLSDVLEIEADIMSPHRPDDIAEVLNYIAAMNLGIEQLETLPISVRLIRNIHRRLMQDVRGGKANPGELRAIQNWIGPQGAPISEAAFVPPPHDKIQDCLGDLETFINGDSILPKLIKIGLAHAQFETIHPFLDGNGRVGRLLITFYLCEQDILTQPVLYISHYFKKHRDTYYDLLQKIRTDGDWESWLRFFLTGVASVSNEATETARRIVDLRETHRQFIAENFGRSGGNAITLMEALYVRPIINVENVARLINVKYPAANNLVERFVKAGLLEEITGQARNRLFRYSPYVNLFSYV